MSSIVTNSDIDDINFLRAKTSEIRYHTSFDPKRIASQTYSPL